MSPRFLEALLARLKPGHWRSFVETFLNISLIIVSVALIVSVILQSKGAGLGGLTGADTGGIFTARRGVEKSLFWVTIGLSVIFFLLAIATVMIRKG
jgi:preprotein translocase subunit SecG